MDGGFIEEQLQKKKEEEQSPPSLLLLSSDQIAQLDIPKTQWLCGNLIPHPGLIAFSGEPGAFKTYFSLFFGKRLSEGRPLFDSPESLALFPAPVLPKAVLFIEEENSINLIKERLDALAPLPEIPFFFYIEQGIKMDDDRFTEEIKKVVQEKHIELIVLDPFSSIHSLRDENSAVDISAFMMRLRADFVKQGTSILFLHHPPKSNSRFDNSNILRGSGDLLAKVDSHFTIKKQNDYIVLEQLKLRQSALLESPIKIMPSIIDKQCVGFEFGGMMRPEIAAILPLREHIIKILSESPDFMSLQSILIALQVYGTWSDRGVMNVLKELSGSNQIIRKKEGRSFVYWTIEGSDNYVNNSFVKVE